MTKPPGLSDSESSFWIERFLPVIVLAQSCALLGSLFVAAYSDARPTEHISFYVDDGWCEASREGIGDHCFGDFYFPQRLMGEDSILENTIGIPHPYFPSTTLFHRVFEVFAAERTGLFVYLVVLAMAGMVPPLVASRGRSWPERVFAVLGLGVLSLPFLITIDRGNSAIVGACFGSLALMFSRRGSARAFDVFAVLASLVRPQYLLLALLSPRQKFSGGLARVGGAFAFIQTLAFKFDPGYSVGDWSVIFKKVALFSESSPVERPYVVNLYFGRSLYRVAERFGAGQGIAQFFSDSLLPSVVVVTAGLVVCGLARKLRSCHFELSAILILALLMIGPSVSYGYYLINSVLIAVVLMADGSNAGQPSGLLRWVLLCALAFSLVPFGWLYDESGMSVSVQLAGPSWLLVLVLASWRGGSLVLRELSLGRRRE